MDRRKFSKNLLTVGAISLAGMNAFGSTTRSKLKITAMKRFPFKPRAIKTRLNTDGSVMDQ